MSNKPPSLAIAKKIYEAIERVYADHPGYDDVFVFVLCPSKGTGSPMITSNMSDDGMKMLLKHVASTVHLAIKYGDRPFADGKN